MELINEMNYEMRAMEDSDEDSNADSDEKDEENT